VRRGTTRGSVVVFGAGGHARVAIDVLRSDGWTVVACVAPGGDGDVSGVPVVDESAVASLRDKRSVRFAHVAIGDNGMRQRIADAAVEQGFELATGISGRAYVADDVVVGSGSLVVHGAVVNVGSRLGRCCIVNTAASVDHDGVLGDFVHVAPGTHLAGNVHVGDQTFVGIGSSVIPGIDIGRGVTIGAGSVVIRPVADDDRVWGNPARSRKAAT
jgi:UDP-perosamine 4-acetyltransferase